MANTPANLDEGLLIPIQFSLEEARAALAQLESQARAAGVKIGDGVAGGTKGFAALKTEMGRGRETAMFFTQALGEFGPQGRTAQIAISGIAGAFLGGGGLLAVLGLAQAAVRLVVDAWEEEERAAKAAAEAAKKAAEERARMNRDAVGFAGDRLASLRSMVAAFKETTAAEKAHGEVVAINAQLATMSAGPHRRMVELRLAAAQALEKEVAGLEASKKAREAEEAFYKEWVSLREMGLKRLEAAERVEATRASELLVGKAEAFRQYLAAMEAALGQAEARFARPPPIPVPPMPTVGDVREADAFLQSNKIREQSLLDLQQTGVGAYQALARSAAAAFGPMLTGSRAYSQAMRAAGGAAQDTADLSAAAFAAMLQNVMASVAQEAAVKSIFQVAEGLAALATGNPGAAAHFAAAAKYAAVAGLAGIGAAAIGASRGMTAAEQANVDAVRQGNAGGSSSVTSGGAREFGGGSASAGGTVHTRELIVVTGSPFETPAETARRAARTLGLMAELNMIPARSA